MLGASYVDAFMAAVAIGLFEDMTKMTRWVKIKKIVTPKPDIHKQFALKLDFRIWILFGI
jgi:hypothetical protein